ncbi:MAG: 30S ribosomal protein S3 [Nitrospinae bacterium]|nr:30S ribosomal protein S3 [Nitrospinota bacterium]
MGQKTHPIGFRLGVIKPWLSNWYSVKNYARQLHEDLALRKYIKKVLFHAGISKIEIERRTKQIRINIHAARPGIIIGKKGAEVDILKNSLAKMIGDKIELSLNILEVRRPELDAQLVAENIAMQLEKRIAFRRAMKKSVTTTMRFGAKGIRINCSGRLAGAEIARMEWYREGRVPLHTLRADIDYGTAEAHTTFGLIGVKVWLFHGEVIKRRGAAAEAAEAAPEAETKKAK